ncbi:hypothetical protein, partial [Pseudomonas aeruginosa]|uniref:hypothetical protein n=1 Tax=Pseudomonas aeruginosa TaxID=287 RepID=UPI00300D4A98
FGVDQFSEFVRGFNPSLDQDLMLAGVGGGGGGGGGAGGGGGGPPPPPPPPPPPRGPGRRYLRSPGSAPG